jgi:LacI family transcriptional regulator
MRQAGRPVSIKDVARESGVSAGTVSNVLNHPERVTEAKRLRVEEAVRRLRFVRNESARHLRTGNSHTLGLLLLDVWNPFFTEMARGVEDWAFDRGWPILISNSARQPAREVIYLNLFAERRVDGIIVVPHGDITERLIDLRNRGIATVMVDQRGSDDTTMSVSLDDVHGGELAATHLLQLGHRRISFIGNPDQVTQVRDRLFGATKAVAASNLPVQLGVLEPTDLTVAAGRDIGEMIVGLPPSERSTALFAGNDLVAIGIMQILLRAGVRIPHEIAIVGYDDIEFARQSTVPLTSIRQPAYEMGRTAAQLITAALTGEPPTSRHVVFEPELVIRESTIGRDTDPVNGDGRPPSLGSSISSR